MLKMNTLKEQVQTACKLSGISLTRLGKGMGMSQQSISKRLSNGKLTKEEMYKIARFSRNYNITINPIKHQLSRGPAIQQNEPPTINSPNKAGNLLVQRPCR